MQHIHIPPDFSERRKKAINLSVGETYGNFTISKIYDLPNRDHYRVEFRGAGTLEGYLQYSDFTGGLYFKADDDQISKLPQIFKDAYKRNYSVQSFVVNDPVEVSGVNFHTKNSEGRYKKFSVKIKVPRLTIIVPTLEETDAPGAAADIADIEFLEKNI